MIDLNKYAEFLKNELQETTEIVFLKADNSERVINCSLNKELLVELFGDKYSDDAISTPSDKLNVLDTDINQWRSFSLKRVLKINGIPVLEFLSQLN